MPSILSSTLFQPSATQSSEAGIVWPGDNGSIQIGKLNAYYKDQTIVPTSPAREGEEYSVWRLSVDSTATEAERTAATATVQHWVSVTNGDTGLVWVPTADESDNERKILSPVSVSIQGSETNVDFGTPIDFSLSYHIDSVRKELKLWGALDWRASSGGGNGSGLYAISLDQFENVRLDMTNIKTEIFSKTSSRFGLARWYDPNVSTSHDGWVRSYSNSEIGVVFSTTGDSFSNWGSSFGQVSSRGQIFIDAVLPIV